MYFSPLPFYLFPLRPKYVFLKFIVIFPEGLLKFVMRCGTQDECTVYEILSKKYGLLRGATNNVMLDKQSYMHARACTRSHASAYTNMKIIAFPLQQWLCDSASVLSHDVSEHLLGYIFTGQLEQMYYTPVARQGCSTLRTGRLYPQEHSGTHF
jgi:hypothetical protein